MAENVTKEEIARAKELSLLEYVKSKYEFEQHGNNSYRLKHHNSVVIFDNTNSYYWYSRSIGGDILSFMINFEDIPLPQAVKQLLNLLTETPITRYRPVEENYEIQRKEVALEIPNKDDNNKRAFAYLVTTRGIDPDIVRDCLHDGTIYQSKRTPPLRNTNYTFNNVVFVGKDKDTIKYCSERSLNDNSGYKYKGDSIGSDKSYGFKLLATKECNTVTVGEAPIDILSLATISKATRKDYKDMNYISLGGISDKALKVFLKDNPQVKHINFCLDNDPSRINEAGVETGLQGQRMSARYKEKYEKLGYTVTVSTPKLKDYNLELLSFKEHLNESVISLPEKDTTEPLVNYLTNIRKIDKDIVDEYIKSGVLSRVKVPYTNKEGKTSTVNSMCFTQLSKYNNPLYTIASAMNTSYTANEFIFDIRNSDSKKSMYIEESNSKNLIITDSPLTILTHKTALKQKGIETTANYLCSSAYTLNSTVREYLTKNTSIQKINIILNKNTYSEKNTQNILKTIESVTSELKLCKAVVTKESSYNKDFLVKLGVDVTKSSESVKPPQKTSQKSEDLGRER